MNKLFIIFLLSSFLLVGCEYNPFEQSPYQIIKDEDGKIYRLDKKTGKMAVIKDNKVMPLETPESTYTKESREKLLEEPKEWGDQRISGKKLKVAVRTNWRSGKLNYALRVFPYSSLEKIFRKLENVSRYNTTYRYRTQNFIINFYDKNSFKIKSITVSMWDMTRIVNKNGEVIELSIKSSVACSQRDYLSIADSSVTWILDEERIPDYAFEDKMNDCIMAAPKSYGKVDHSIDKDVAENRNYWLIADSGEKYYFSTEEELIVLEDTVGKRNQWFKYFNN